MVRGNLIWACIKACTQFSHCLLSLMWRPCKMSPRLERKVDSGNLALTLVSSGFWCHARFGSLSFPFAAWDTAFVSVAPPGEIQKKARLDLHVAGSKRAHGRFKPSACNGRCSRWLCVCERQRSEPNARVDACDSAQSQMLETRGDGPGVC